jgi:hypothetical protein
MTGLFGIAIVVFVFVFDVVFAIVVAASTIFVDVCGIWRGTIDRFEERMSML